MNKNSKALFWVQLAEQLVPIVFNILTAIFTKQTLTELVAKGSLEEETNNLQK